MENTFGIGQLKLIQLMMESVTITWNRREDFQQYMGIILDLDNLITELEKQDGNKNERWSIN